MQPNKIRKLNCDQRWRRIENALKELSKSIACNLNETFDLEIETENSETILWAEAYKKFIEELKEKIKMAENVSGKIKI